MPNNLLNVAFTLRLVFLICQLLLVQTSISSATTCDPQNGTYIIGFEYVATSCIPEGMNDGTVLNYRRSTIICSGGQVVQDPTDPYAVIDGQASPQAVIDGRISAGFKVLRNNEGSHLVGVHRYYTGLIDGKSMGGYVFGFAYPTVFTSPIYLTPPTPDCQGFDFNDPGNPPNPNTPPSPADPGGAPPSGSPPPFVFSPPGTPPNFYPPEAPPPDSPPENDPPCEDDCCNESGEAPGGSTVNRNSGRLSHSQALFSVNTGSPLYMGVTLSYVSPAFAPSTIGNGWSHNYEARLQVATSGVVTYWTKGTKRIYSPSSSGYYSQRGDYSSLTKNGNGTYVVTDTNGFRINFDTAGNATSMVDRYGNTLNLIYTSGKLTSVQDASAATTRFITFAYNGDGKLSTITDPKGTNYTLSYTSDFLTTVSLPGGDQWGYTYNPVNNLLATKVDPNLNSTAYQYTGQKVTMVTDPQSQNRSYGFAASASPGKIPDCYYYAPLPIKTFTFVEKDNGNWTYTYDTLTGRVQRKTDPLGNITYYTYNPQGNLLSITEPPLNGIRYTRFFDYDSLGNPIAKSEPIDAVAANIVPSSVTAPASDPRIKIDYRYSYDLTNPLPAFKNRIISIIDQRNPANTYTTSFSYNVDANGYLVTTITNPGNISSTLRQHSNGKLKDTTDANGKTTSYTYRSDGLPESVTAPSGVSIYFTDYDANGNAREIQAKDNTGALSKKTNLVYDSPNRLQSSTVTTSGQPAITVSYGYDGTNNITSVIDPELRETLYEYNYNHQVKKLTNALGKFTTITYGSTGCPSCGGGVDKITDIEDANHHHTHYEYDQLGKLGKETDPLGKAIRYTYHANGLIKEKIDATDPLNEKVQITYSYNSRRQLTTKHYANGAPDTVFTYDNGRIKTAANGNISYTFNNYTTGSYKGRLKSITDTTNTRTVSYDQYTNLGQRKQVTVTTPAGSRTTTYQYDAVNRPWIISAGTKVFTFLYDKLGRRDTLSYPIGITTTHNYDNLDRLKGLTHTTTSGNITFANYSGFDKSGNRLNKITPNGTETYHYDNTYRLTQTDTPKGSEKYTYDDVGNRTGGPGPKESLPLVTYAYDNANRMTHGRQIGYDNDDAGNQTTRTIPNAPNKDWTLTWDLENRLTQVQKVKKNSNGDITESRTIAFKYDPFGRRIQKQMTTLVDGVTKTTTWQYIYDGSDIAQEIYTKPDGTIENTWYTHGPGTDEHLAMERGGINYYFHADGLGSITAITNESAFPVQTYNYDSYGVPKQTSSFRNSYQYTGREYDPETGLYYYRARYYDPREGRFISKDPSGFAGGNVNLFAFTSNDPINWIDPYGDARIKGERGQTGKPSGTNNPDKHIKPDPNDPDWVIYTDPHTGKKIRKPKPPGYCPKNKYESTDSPPAIPPLRPDQIAPWLLIPMLIGTFIFG